MQVVNVNVVVVASVAVAGGGPAVFVADACTLHSNYFVSFVSFASFWFVVCLLLID